MIVLFYVLSFDLQLATEQHHVLGCDLEASRVLHVYLEVSCVLLSHLLVTPREFPVFRTLSPPFHITFVASCWTFAPLLCFYVAPVSCHRLL
ncbi:hypothetical protein LY78DRAFT_238686 [Colletotrichum sublineola]|nr:hypothetical protein LY78DRAFT_238686 [Colletotrichum sublineola]